MTNKIGRFGTVLETALAAGILVLGNGRGGERAASAARFAAAGWRFRRRRSIRRQGPGQPGPGMPPQGAQQQQGPAAGSRIRARRASASSTATFRRSTADSNDWAAATLNTPVVNGDHISTGPNARAEIQLDHANVLRLSDQTTANLVNLSRTQMQLQIGQGLANYEVLKRQRSQH